MFKIFNQNYFRKEYTVGGPNLSPFPYHTVSVPRSRPLPYRFLSLTVGSAKPTEQLILTVRVLVFDREPYRTKMETIMSVPYQFCCDTIRAVYRTLKIYNVYLYTGPIMLRYRIRTAPKLVRYGSRCGSRSSIINE